MQLIMPAVRRLGIIQQTVPAYAEHVWDTQLLDLIVNIDPVGKDGTQDEIEAYLKTQFTSVVARKPQKHGSLNKALKWLCRECDGEYVLYLEDDELITGAWNVHAAIDCMDAYPNLVQLQAPQQDFTEATQFGNAKDPRNVRHHRVGGYYLRVAKYRCSLQPCVWRVSFLKAAYGAIHMDTDPEVQFHEDNPALRRLVDRYDFGTFAQPGDRRIVEDLGLADKRDSGVRKIVGKHGTTWETS